jgi:DNA recombination protein RmuC
MGDAIGILSLVMLAAILVSTIAAARAVRGGQERLDRMICDDQGMGRRERNEESARLRLELARLVEGVERRMETLRATVDERLRGMQEDNGRQLQAMRQTVDEKLHVTLEARLGESFRLVSERLDQVHRGLGEMQTLASGVGDLKRVLTNVKARGTWGEVQLGNLLEQVLTPEQYGTHVATRPGSPERVEFAIKMPGRDGSTVWLPIDAKCPQEDYQRLVHAADQGDADAAAVAGAALEARLRGSAREIADKYLSPPFTTDFGVLFLPTEGLYAEVLRREGLQEALQREHRVMVAGPTTLWALLTSLQMGFRTLAIEKRSSEVWEVLGAVKTEFKKFGGVLEKVQKKLQEATNTIDEVATRKRVLERKLRVVEELPEGEARALLGAGGDELCHEAGDG